MDKKNYRADIDGLRAIAIILVLVYHLFPKYLKGGFVGVDIFFVISGFLITGIILNQFERGTFSFKTFYQRRIKRLYPVLLMVLIFTFIMGWILLLPEEFMALTKHIAGGVFYIANFTLWSEAGYFDSLPKLKPLTHLWSLSIEEQFYLTWPFILFFALKKNISIKKTFLSLTAISFLLNIIYIYKKPDTVFYFPFSRFWEMMIGCGLAIYRHKKEILLAKYNQDIIALTGVTLILASLIGLSEYSYFPGYWALLPTLGTVLLIISQKSIFNTKVLSSTPMVNIGLISYPLYLWHWPLISFMYIKVGYLPHYADKIIILILSLILSWLSYLYIENPIRHSRAKSSSIVSLLITCSIFIGFFGIYVFKQEGLPSRFYTTNQNKQMPQELKKMLSPEFGGHISQNWREHTCFLAKGEGPDKFTPECMAKDSPKIFLWGDSHAAALYFGLKSSHLIGGSKISQYTASACPPLMNWEGAINKKCNEINNSIFQRILDQKPDKLILYSAWYWSEYDIRKLKDTLSMLKEKMPNMDILILGSSPVWKKDVKKTILEYFNKFGQRPPQYTRFGLDSKDVLKTDEKVEEIANKFGVDFASIFNTLCNYQGCMLHTDESLENLTSLDSGHLSNYASKYVINKLEKIIFSLKQRGIKPPLNERSLYD